MLVRPSHIRVVILVAFSLFVSWFLCLFFLVEMYEVDLVHIIEHIVKILLCVFKEKEEN